MKIHAAAPWLLALVLLPGCASSRSGLPDGAEMLAGAQTSLAQDDDRAARQFLAGAASRLENDEQRKQHRVLSAELAIRDGDAGEAAADMDELLIEYPNDPRVHEVAGKARLHGAEFAGATEHFTTAITRYEEEVDVGRASDLLALALGCEAYADGHLVAATEAWQRIADHALRSAVLEASAGVSPGGADDGFLARSQGPSN